jgi:hypothetical protein
MPKIEMQHQKRGEVAHVLAVRRRKSITVGGAI